MKKTFTRKDLIKKLYNETEPTEDAAMEAALETNWKLNEEYEALKSVKAQLDAVKYSPSKTSIQIILAHSRRTAPLETSY